MPHTKPRPVMAGDLAKAAGGVWLLAFFVLLIQFLSISPHAKILAIVGAALIVTAFAFFQLRGRSRRIAQVEDSAHHLLVAGLSALQEPKHLHDTNPDDADNGEFSGLNHAIDQLADRLAEQSKEAAKKSRNLEALIDAIDEPLIAFDDDRNVQLHNRSAETMFDIPTGATLVGRSLTSLFTQEEIIQMHDAARAGEVRRGRVRLTTPVGKRMFQVSAAPVPVAWGEGIFGAVLFLRDVTELDQAVQVKTDFVANASHELRTPVSAIRGAAETLFEAVSDDPEMASRLCGMIHTHATRLEEMLRDLLDLSRLESPDVPLEISAIDMREIVSTLRGFFEPVCQKKNLTLNFEIDDELAGFKTDRRLFTLCLRNLVENATKFAYEGTPVRIVASLVEVDIPSSAMKKQTRELTRAASMQMSGQASSAASADPVGELVGVARFEIIDQGIGIPLNQQERVFERYYQVDPARSGMAGSKRGTGLGLSIVKHAAKALHGRVGLTSAYKEGTTAWFEIPVSFAKKSGAAAASGTAADSVKSDQTNAA